MSNLYAIKVTNFS